VYNYIEPLGIYYISDEMLVKARWKVWENGNQ
jgi:hypothetical protein